VICPEDIRRPATDPNIQPTDPKKSKKHLERLILIVGALVMLIGAVGAVLAVRHHNSSSDTSYFIHNTVQGVVASNKPVADPQQPSKDCFDVTLNEYQGMTFRQCVPKYEKDLSTKWQVLVAKPGENVEIRFDGDSRIPIFYINRFEVLEGI
jgi:hypothetical protein